MALTRREKSLAEQANRWGAIKTLTFNVSRDLAAEYSITASGVEISVDDSGKLVIKEGASIKGINDLLTVATAEYRALLAEENAESAFEARLISVYNGEVDTDITAVTEGSDSADHYAIDENNKITLGHL